jgi:hypothetical protein
MHSATARATSRNTAGSAEQRLQQDGLTMHSTAARATSRNTAGSAEQWPQQDGFYEFNEEAYAVWLAYSQACGGGSGVVTGNTAAASCNNSQAVNMWQAWQGRREHPNHAYAGHPLLSMWPGYIIHLVYYTVHPFNSDQTWSSFMYGASFLLPSGRHSHWLAHCAWYNPPPPPRPHPHPHPRSAGTATGWLTGHGTTTRRLEESEAGTG